MANPIQLNIPSTATGATSATAIPQQSNPTGTPTSAPIKLNMASTDTGALQAMAPAPSGPAPTPDESSQVGFKGLWGAAKNVFNTVFSSEKGVGETVGQGAALNTSDYSAATQSNQQLQNQIFATQKLIAQDKAEGKDTTALENALAKAHQALGITSVANIAPATQKTNAQALGEVGGVALDALTAGSYGTAARGAETGVLLTKEASQAAAKLAAETATKTATKETLGTTLKTIAKQTAGRAAVGGGIGYASDVSQNLQSGKTGANALTPGIGTATGVLLPTAIGGVRAGVAIGREEAPRFINSLIKPSKANFSYGHNPGKTVAELGITGNSLPDFEKNITTAKQNVGSQIGAVYANPANANIRIDATNDIAKIDTAIDKAAAGGKNNQGIVTQLMNIKDGLLYGGKVDANGEIVHAGATPRNLTNLSAPEAQDLIQHVSQQTRFTGSPSDDKTVNSILKDIYGGIREKINAGVSPNNPEITKLNQQYGDLTSAELATRNRDAIVARSNMLGLTNTATGLSVGLMTEVLSGQPITAALAGVGSIALEKALSSTAFKTRMASWLSTETPQVIRSVTKNNPQLVPILLKAFPNFVAKLKG